MSQGRRRRRQSGRPAWVPLAGVLAGVVLLAVLGFTLWRVVSPDLTTATPGAGDRYTVLRALSPQASACLDQVRTAEALVEAARPAAESWKTYNETRTRAGQTTATERDAAYAAAVAQGREQVERFKAAESDYARLAASCGAVSPTDYPGDKQEAARSCLDRAKVAAEEAEAARAVVKDWSQHLDRLAKLESGDLSKARYTSQWDDAYRKAPSNIDRFLGRPVDQYRTGDQAHLSSQERLAKAPECRLAPAT